MGGTWEKRDVGFRDTRSKGGFQEVILILILIDNAHLELALEGGHGAGRGGEGGMEVMEHQGIG